MFLALSLSLSLSQAFCSRKRYSTLYRYLMLLLLQASETKKICAARKKKREIQNGFGEFGKGIRESAIALRCSNNNNHSNDGGRTHAAAAAAADTKLTE